MKKEELNKGIEEQEKKEKPKRRPILSKVIILFLFFGLIYIYARYVGTMGIQVREYNIINEKLPSSFDGFSIVQFSDLELGSTFLVQDMEKLVEKVNELKPDVVVFTGDIVSTQHTLSDEEKELLIDHLSKMDPLIGKYSVKGDDDQYNGVYEEVMDASIIMN